MNEWEIKDNKLRKLYIFDDFVAAMKFADSVGELAERENHHPDIFISYNKVELTLWTHDSGKITDKDTSLASTIDNL